MTSSVFHRAGRYQKARSFRLSLFEPDSMKIFHRPCHAFLGLLLALMIPACGKESRTTDTVSSTFSSLAEKVAFLERYVVFRRAYDDLDFRIEFRDGGDGRMASPSEWNVRVSAIVPAAEIEQWSEGFDPASDPDLAWVAEIPGGPKDLDAFDWVEDGGRIVGIDRGGRRVLYRNLVY